MRIPVGDFGNRVSQTAPGARVPAGAFITPGLGDAGESAGKVVHNEISQQLAEQERAKREREGELKTLDEQARRNRTAAAFAEYQVGLEQFSTDISNRLTEGQVTRDAANTEYADGLAKLKKDHLDALDPRSKADLADNLILFEGRSNARFQEGLRNNAKRERAGNFTNTVESLERLAVTDRPAALNQAAAAYKTEGTALFGADVAAKQMQGFRERVAFTDWNNRLLAAKGNVKALNEIATDVQKDADLDPDKKTVIVGRAQGFRETLLNQAERAAQSRERTIRSMFDARDKTILAGFTPSAEDDAKMLAVSKGTPYEQAVKSQVQFAAQTAAFSAAPPAKQEQYLNSFEAEVRKNPTPDGQKTLEAYKKIMKNQAELVKDDPVSFAAQRGAPIQPLDFSKVDTLADQLQARINVARGVQAQYNAPLKVLTREEAKQFSDFLNKGTSDDRIQLLGTLKTAIKDAEAYNATMQQIAPDSPVTAWAGSLVNRRAIVERNTVRPDVVTQASTASQLMLRGEGILNPSRAQQKEDGKGSAFKMPDEKDLRSGFESAMGEAYRARPDAHAIAYQSTKAVYAALSADEGDYSGDFKAARWDKAMLLATGGAMDFNGKKVVRPYSMEDGEFKNAVYYQMGQLVKSGRVGLTQQQLQRLQLETAGDSKYLVRSGSGYLLDKRGQPVMIDLYNETTPTDTSGIPGNTLPAKK